MHVAAWWGHLDIVKLLKQHSNETTKYGNTVLHSAAEMGRESIVWWLLEVDPYLINEKNKDGNTALHIAVIEGYPAVVEILKSLKDEKNHDKETALEIAKSMNHTTIIELLSDEPEKGLDRAISDLQTQLDKVKSLLLK